MQYSANIKLLFTILSLVFFKLATPCTSLLITKGASTDSSTMITYSADSHTLYGAMYYSPEKFYKDKEKLKIINQETGRYKGDIDQVEHTYNVVGFMNEHQLAISETTFGGREELIDTSGLLDYENLIYLALQRARNAREAISVINKLVKEYGYCSSGESFSIADQHEVWIMEIIGKGLRNKGAVWVAQRVPDGYVSAHANQSRIQKFPLNDRENCLYSDDVISFAKKQGYHKGKDEDFNFRDAYAPITWEYLRWCEARVWNFFRHVAPNQVKDIDYTVNTKEISLPLWVKPDTLLSVKDVMNLMRDHFEGTNLDLSTGIGAGPYNLPYRWRPLQWKSDSIEYCNDRSISTQQTAYSFVSQSRYWLPNYIGGLLWFGFDDTYSTCYMPIYCGITEIPKSFKASTANFDSFSWESAFWIFNFVANYAYSRYSDMIKDIQQEQVKLENSFIVSTDSIDNIAAELYIKSASEAQKLLTDFSVSTANETVQRWKKLGEFLLWKYLDGNVRDDSGKVTHPGYPKEWYKLIEHKDSEKYKMRKLDQ